MLKQLFLSQTCSAVRFNLFPRFNPDFFAISYLRLIKVFQLSVEELRIYILIKSKQYKAIKFHETLEIDSK